MILQYERYCALKTAIQIVGEALIILSAFTIILTFQSDQAHSITLRYAILFTLICQASIYFFGLYNPTLQFGLTEQLIGLAQALSIAIAAIVISILIVGKSIYFFSIFVSFGTLLASLILWRRLMQKVSNTDIFRQKVIILGTKGRAEAIYQALRKKKNPDKTKQRNLRPCNIRIVAVADTQENTCSFPIEEKTPYVQLKNCSDVLELSCEYNTRQVIVCNQIAGNLTPQEVYELKRKGILLCSENAMFEAISGRRDPAEIDPKDVIFSQSFQRKIQRYTKRFGDLAVAFALLALLSPFFLAVGFVLKAIKPGRIIETESCLGLRKKVFNRYRFHSSPKLTHYPIYHQRIQALPQLWNVLKADMSLVGPCPIGPQQAEDISHEQLLFDERFTVRPGLTGWAQVNHQYDGSNKTIKDMFGYDLFYLKHMSLFLDIVVISRALLVQSPTSRPVTNAS